MIDNVAKVTGRDLVRDIDIDQTDSFQPRNFWRSSTGRQILVHKCQSIEVAQRAQGLAAHKAQVLGFFPAIPRAARPFQQLAGVAVEPVTKPARQLDIIQQRIRGQQVAQVVKKAKVVAIQGVRRLRKFTVVAPGAVIRGGCDRRNSRVLLGYQEAAVRGQQVRVLLVTWIEQVGVTLIYCELAKQGSPRLSLVFITQQPGIVTFAGRWCRKAMQVDLHFVVDALVAVFAELFAAQETNLSHDFRLGQGCSSGRQDAKVPQISSRASGAYQQQ